MTDNYSNRNTQQWLAVTGDVVRSRELTEADMDRLRGILEICNRKFTPTVPFSVQAGDEIQSLFAGDGNPVRAIFELQAFVFPVGIRWGIGRGLIASPVRETTAEMRGPAFEYSRKALTVATDRKKIAVINAGASDFQAPNLILGLISGIIAGWNEQTFRRYCLYDASHSIYKVAQQEGVSAAAINKHINLKNIRLVLDGIDYCDNVLSEKSTPGG